MIEPILIAAGFSIRYLDAPVEEFSADALQDPDLLVVLGGPFDVGDCSQPFLAPEIEGVRQRSAAGRAVLGICLGAQILARSLGAAVCGLGAKEFGWKKLDLTEDGQSSAIANLKGVDVLHWHGDGFELPVGASRLASTDLCPNQAFSVGPSLLGVQFHIEVNPQAGLQNWIDGHAVDLDREGIDHLTIQQQTNRAAKQNRSGVQKFIKDWIFKAIK